MYDNLTFRQVTRAQTSSGGDQQGGQKRSRGHPSEAAEAFRHQEGSLVIAEERGDGILIRPAVALPVEHYSPERVAEFLLTNAVDAADYRRAVARVRGMGLDPDSIPHVRPK